MTENANIDALIEVMNTLVDEELRLKNELKQIEKKKDEVQFEMEQVLKEENKEVITFGYWSFGWQVKNRTAFDQKLFKERHPDLYEEFKTTKEIRSFCFGHKED